MTEIRCAVELRADDTGTSPGRLFGTLMRYGEPAAGGRREVFEPGSLEWPAEGVTVNRQHNRRAPIMRVVPEERDGAVVVDAPLPDTAAGRDAAREIRDGLMVGLSVEFRAALQTYAGGMRRIKRAILRGAGLVHNPEYRGAAVELRDRGRGSRGGRRWQ